MTPRTLAVVAIWVGAVLGGVVIAVSTRIGPVLVVLPGDGHGLHAGDLVGFAATAAVAAAGTRFVRRL